MEISSKRTKKTSNLIPDTNSMTLSERIRKCRELLSEIKVENDDEDVIYCGTIEYDPQKVEIIRIFLNCCLGRINS